MQTTIGLMTYLSQRLGTAGLWVVVLLAVALAVAAGLTALAISELFVAGVDPIQVAPVRWWRRY